MASLFDGIGGFPLAGLIDGIKTLWTSEIELFPIAVTMERFRELFLRVAAVLVHTGGAEYITVKELRDEVQKNHSFFRKFVSVFTKRKSER